MKNTCASCKGLSVKKIIKTSNEKKPKWLEKMDYVVDFIEKNKKIKIKKQPNTDTTLILDVGKSKANRYVLYWGAQKSKKILINDAKKAYGDFKNNGIAKVNKNGLVKLHFNCPQCYSTVEKGKKNKETFYKHIHFCYSNASNNKWLDSVYTKIIVCKHNLKQTMEKHKKGEIILLNALPCKYYQKAHIPNSFNLPYNTKISQKDLFQWIKDVSINYPKLNKLLKQKKINIYELPIIVYCAHDKCNASEQLAINLLKKGFVNIGEFPGGMKDYY